MTPGKVAVIIERLRVTGNATDVDLLAEHIDAIVGENQFFEHFKRMTEVTAQSIAAENATRDEIAAMRPLMATVASAYDRMTLTDARRVALEEATAAREEAAALAAAAREEAAEERKYQHVISPLVAAIVTFVATASGFYFWHP